MKKISVLLFFIVMFLSFNISSTKGKEYNNSFERAPILDEYKMSNKDSEVIAPTIRAEREFTLIDAMNYSIDVIKDASFPATYRLSNNAGDNQLTVKNQGTTNTCWTFASTSSLESNLRIRQNNYTDYSTFHMNNALAYSYSSGYNTYGNKENNSGGNFEHAMLYWTSNLGPVTSFQNGVTLRNMATTMVNPANVSVDEVYLVDRFYNTLSTTAEKAAFRNEIKGLVQNYGAVYFHAAAPQGSHFNETYSSVYTDSVLTYNNSPHAMVIVGWDDSFSRYNFNPINGSYPSINGAWIVQNSWGTSVGEDGYYYYSYEDYMIGIFASGVKKSGGKTYDNTYQYNPTGEISYGKAKYIANKYNKISTKEEQITSVGVFAYARNTKVNIYINSKDSDLSKATKVNSSPITISYAGYYNYYLPSPINIEGNEFSVIIEYVTFDPNSATYKYSVPVHDLSHSSLTKEQVGIMPNQSYFSSNKTTWTDLYKEDCAAAIKVHTKNINEEQISIETFIKNPKIENTDRIIYLDTYTYKVTNASSINYKIVDIKGKDVTSNFNIYDSKVVNNYSTAILTAKSNMTDGIYKVTASVNGVSSTKTFIVGEGYKTTLLYDNAIVGIDYSRDLSKYIDSYEVLTWKSSNNNIATVKDGVVTGISAGTTDIVINNIYKIKVTVKEPIYISNANDFLNIQNDLDEYYLLSSDIDFKDVTYTTISSTTNPFKGIINGNNHIVKNITLNGDNYTSLIGYVKAGSVSNIGFENIDIKGKDNTGIIGYISYGNVDNIYLYNSKIEGSNNVGIIGSSELAIISNSFNTSNIIGVNNVSGLIGYANSSTIIRNYNIGEISGATSIGGVVGYSNNCIIKESYNEGKITSNKVSGGIAGTFDTSMIYDSYNKGNIKGENSGGIIGNPKNSDYLVIENTYNIGIVSGNKSGGITGYGTLNSGDIYVTDNYDISDSIPIFGLTLTSTNSKELSIDNLKKSSNYVNYDFTNTWKMEEYPILKNIMHPTNITITKDSYTINVGEKILLKDSVISSTINKIKMYSLNNDNVSIDNDYLIANKVGVTTVTISTTNGIKKTYTINVVDVISDTEYSLEDGYMLGIQSGTDYKTFLEKVESTGVSLYADSELISDEKTIVSTDMKLKVSKDGQELTYVVIVNGDVNGDGYVRMNDIMITAQYIVEYTGIEGNNLIAADVNSDGNIRMNDIMIVAKYLVEGGTL